MTENYILALDEGTTGARAIVFDEKMCIKGVGQTSFPQIYPEPGWVEQNPKAIWDAQMTSIKVALKAAKIEPYDLSAIGVTNQRETTILWEKRTGEPIYNAVVWQCRRTANIVDFLKKNHEMLFKEKTGLIVDSYFSGPKVKWILDNIGDAREHAKKGDILFGTVDTYLIHRLTNGKTHTTDVSNASRTLMFNINDLQWDTELLEILKIPEQILPQVKPSSTLFGYTDPAIFGASVPITGVAGDQQASLFGHRAFREGESKCTFGTGNFLLMNTGRHPVSSEKLLTTVAWGKNNETFYALEGSIFVTGAAIQWLRDGLKIIEDFGESEVLARSLSGNDGVYFVPALTGLGAPYWDQYARGLIMGITRGTERAHIARAVLESVAYLTRDVVEAMERDSGLSIKELRVDGGAARNRFLMQFQADILDAKILRPSEIEATAKGAAYLAGLMEDVWDSQYELMEFQEDVEEFLPEMSEDERNKLYRDWSIAVRKTLSII